MLDNGITIQELYGSIGEKIVEMRITEEGYTWTRGDKERRVGDHLLGELDVDFVKINDIKNLADKCRNSEFCEISDNLKPCYKNEFYEPNLDSSTHFFIPQTIGEFHNFGFYCSVRLDAIVIRDYNINDFPASEKFMRDHMVINRFIHSLLSKREMPNSYLEFNGKKRKLNWGSAPGRLDYFAFKDGRYYCIDAKVNNSKLSLWQEIRMAWMFRCGHISQIFNVKFECSDREQLTRIFQSNGVDEAIKTLDHKIFVIDYNPSVYEEAESIISNYDDVIRGANSSKHFYTNKELEKKFDEKRARRINVDSESCTSFDSFMIKFK